MRSELPRLSLVALSGGQRLLLVLPVIVALWALTLLVIGHG